MRRMNKKGAIGVYELLLAIFVLAIIVNTIILENRAFPETIGKKQMLASYVIGEAELELFRVDQDAKYSAFDSLKELASHGGYAGEAVCGNYGDYAFWSTKGAEVDTCFPDVYKEIQPLMIDELAKRGLTDYDLYVDQYKIIGITPIPEQKYAALIEDDEVLSSINYYPKKSFKVDLDYPFSDYKILKGLAQDIIAECTDKSEEQLTSCVNGRASRFETLNQNKFDITVERILNKRQFTVEVKQLSYKNVFTGDVSIKFAIGLEGLYRMNPSAFADTRFYFLNKTGEKYNEVSFYPAAAANPRDPLQIEINLPLSEYGGRMGAVSFSFNPGESITEKSQLAIREETAEFKPAPPNILDMMKGLSREGTDYYLSSGIEQYYVMIPKQPSEITIIADYTGAKEYTNTIVLKFVDTDLSGERAASGTASETPAETPEEAPQPSEEELANMI